MESAEIDLYLHIEQQIKEERKSISLFNIAIKKTNNKIYISEKMMKFLVQEFTDELNDFEKQEIFDRMKDKPHKEIELLRVELVVYILFKQIFYLMFYLFKFLKITHQQQNILIALTDPRAMFGLKSMRLIDDKDEILDAIKSVENRLVRLVKETYD
jgi:hypothetical protein